MEPVRVLIVEASSAMRRTIRSALARDPRVLPVATTRNAQEALAFLESTPVELIALDVDLPHPGTSGGGLDPITELRRAPGRPTILLLTEPTNRGAMSTLEALSRGAADYVAKPASTDADALARFSDDLVQRILALTRRTPARPRPSNAQTTPGATVRRAFPTGDRPRLLVIGASTGGPDAVTRLLQALPPLGVPIAIVQHMPAGFTRLFAERLSVACKRTVVEAVNGARLLPGMIVVAPGDVHLQVGVSDGELIARLDRGPQVNSVRPSLDVLLGSAAEACGSGTLAVVLTGLGRDGCDGAGRLVAGRGSVIVQDEASSVVWGMPGSIVRAGLAQLVLPLDQIANAVASRMLLATVTGGTP